jgi:hypothetical protein
VVQSQPNKIRQLLIIDPAQGHDIDLDPNILFQTGINAPSDPIEEIPSGDSLKLGLIQGIQRDIYPLQSSSPQPFGFRSQQSPVRGHPQISLRILGQEPFYEPSAIPANQGFSSGQANLAQPKPAGQSYKTKTFFIGQNMFVGNEGVVSAGITVKTTQIAPIGYTQP